GPRRAPTCVQRRAISGAAAARIALALRVLPRDGPRRPGSPSASAPRRRRAVRPHDPDANTRTARRMDLRARLQSVAPVSGRQFAAFRIALGTYLAIHFGSLIHWGPELFSRVGALGNARLNPIYGLLPNVLARWDAPSVVTAFLVAMSALSVLFALGVQRRLVAVVLWYGWACLFNRNVLIANAALPYVGFLLLLTAIVPAREPWRLTMGRRANAQRDRFEMAAGVWLAAWAVLATGYAFAGAVKLLTPSWIDGTAVWHVLHGPLVRPSWLRDIALAIPADVL